MGTGAADSWYHEKESAWLYGAVAAAEPDPVRRDAVPEARRRRRTARPPAGSPRRSGPSRSYSRPPLRARVVARLVRRIGPRRLRGVLAAMKLRGLSVYSGPRAPATHAMPTTVADVGNRHARWAEQPSRRGVRRERWPRFERLAGHGRGGRGLRAPIGADRRHGGTARRRAVDGAPVNTSRCVRSVSSTNTRWRWSAKSWPSIRTSRSRRAGAHLQRARHRYGRSAPDQPQAAVDVRNRRSRCWHARSWASIRTTWARPSARRAPRSGCFAVGAADPADPFHARIAGQ